MRQCADALAFAKNPKYKESHVLSNQPLCIYHHNCADGFGAAWACWKSFNGNVELYPGKYQTGAPPDELIEGRTVFIVDFSYKRADLRHMCAKAEHVVVLDHHKSAAAELAGLEKECPNLFIVFDMERSGARIAWDYFHGARRLPRLIEHIEDRDLWRFRLPYTREIQAALFSFPYDIKIWDDLITREDGLKALMLDGVAIERKHFKDIAELLESMTQRALILGHNVPCVNLPYIYSSDVGNKLAANEPFAACYWDTKHGRTYSLRSREDSPRCVDVSEIAAAFGGGGHKHAAGFSLSGLRHPWGDTRIIHWEVGEREDATCSG
jgi:oligoribonuclease NrnB/cAMP/cGMP phosphodiesterase (DHH superfamily)